MTVDADSTKRIADEVFPPPPLRAPRGAWGWLRYIIRLLLDARVGAIWWRARRELPLWSGRVLDVGCGDGPWRWMLSPETRYVGLDVPLAATGFGYRTGAACQVLYDGKRFPFADAAFSHVLCTEVLEHVSDPARVLAECFRVVAPGGGCFFSVPFAARHHYVPFDYWRFTTAALDQLFREAGWVQIRIIPLGTDVSVAAYKANALFLKLIFGHRPAWWRTLALALALVLSPIYVVLTMIEVVSTLGSVGSELDPLGYLVLAVRPPTVSAVVVGS